jgi:hypothetical protein
MYRLFTVVRKIVYARYGEEYTINFEVQQFVGFMASRTPIDPTNAHLVSAYFYGCHDLKESLTKPNWLVEVFNKDLN